MRRTAPPDVAARSAAPLEVKSRQGKSNQVTPNQVKSPDVAARSAAPLELQPACRVSNGERDHNRLGHLLARRFGARAGARRVALGQGDCPHLWGRDPGRHGEHLHAGRACCPHPRKATVHTSAESIHIHIHIHIHCPHLRGERIQLLGGRGTHTYTARACRGGRYGREISVDV